VYVAFKGNYPKIYKVSTLITPGVVPRMIVSALKDVD